jgi:hypothetical protein
MPSIADLLTSTPDSLYPRWLTDDGRFQYMPAEGRYAMLLQVDGVRQSHWCGYVLVPNRESVIDLEDKYLSGWAYSSSRTPRITYSGPGSRQISWRWYNAAKQLRTQAQLNDSGDWWVGFDTMEWYTPAYTEAEMCDILVAFEYTLHVRLDVNSRSAR